MLPADTTTLWLIVIPPVCKHATLVTACHTVVSHDESEIVADTLVLETPNEPPKMVTCLTGRAAGMLRAVTSDTIATSNVVLDVRDESLLPDVMTRTTLPPCPAGCFVATVDSDVHKEASVMVK